MAFYHRNYNKSITKEQANNLKLSVPQSCLNSKRTQSGLHSLDIVTDGHFIYVITSVTSKYSVWAKAKGLNPKHLPAEMLKRISVV